MVWRHAWSRKLIMINVQSTLSPLLSALLMKEFPLEELAQWASLGSFDLVRDRAEVDRFLDGLEEHRLDLQGDSQKDGFCATVLTYLEALLDPGDDQMNESGIEMTASLGTTVWYDMNEEQRRALWKEAKELHTIIAPLSASEAVLQTLHAWRVANNPKN